MTPERIKEIRERLKMTKERFANHIGATLGTVNNWESGRSKPSPVWAKKLESLEKRANKIDVTNG